MLAWSNAAHCHYVAVVRTRNNSTSANTEQQESALAIEAAAQEEHPIFWEAVRKAAAELAATAAATAEAALTADNDGDKGVGGDEDVATESSMLLVELPAVSFLTFL
jgi:hypothetical protein